MYHVFLPEKLNFAVGFLAAEENVIFKGPVCPRDVKSKPPEIAPVATAGADLESPFAFTCDDGGKGGGGATAEVTDAEEAACPGSEVGPRDLVSAKAAASMRA